MIENIKVLGGTSAVARICGVSASAISQAKKGQGGSSLAKYIALLSFLHVNHPKVYSEFIKTL